MAYRHPRILLAAIPDAARAMGRALSDFQFTLAHTYDEAVQQLREEPPALVIVTYHFDELRPDRLIQLIRAEGQEIYTPIILVRVLPFQLSRQDEEGIRSAYKSLGIDEFVNLYDDQQRLGVEPALQRFRDLVSTLLRRAGARNSGEG